MTDIKNLKEVTEDQLVNLHMNYKVAEEDARKGRIAIEAEIYMRHKDDLPVSGTTNLASGMKIVTGLSDNWDQDMLVNIRDTSWKQLTDTVPFPFTVELKANSKEIAYIKDKFPELYKILQQALTQKEKKPTFTTKASKGGDSE